MLPVENTTSGSINDVYDAIIGSQLSIVGEEIFHVKHCLVGTEEIALNKDLMQNDGIHPNAEAQPLIASFMDRHLRSLILDAQ